jgi:DNA-binding transcriptional LysR family regulator
VLLDMLRDGQIDAGFTGEKVRGRGLEHQLVATDEWLLLAPADHEWRRMVEPAGDGALAPPGVRFAQLREQPLIVETVESKLGLQTRRELQDLLDERGLAWRELRIALELPDAQAVRSAVLRGAGVGLLPRSALGTIEGMRLFALQGQPLLRRLYMVRSRRITPSRVAGAWWDFVVAQQTARQADTTGGIGE